MEESWDAAMAESWNLMSKAKDFLMTKTSNEEVAKAISPLFMHQETREHQAALALYECCVANFAGFLTLKLLKAYRNSPDGIFRFRTIHLLSEAIAQSRNRNFRFPLSVLRLAKPLLISCLKMQETKQSDIKILHRVVSFVAYNVALLDDGGWDELNDFILSLASTQTLNAFSVFVDLPAVYGKLISTEAMQSVLDKAKVVLLNPEKGKAGDWILALETHLKIGVQRSGFTTKVRDNVVRSARKVVAMGMEEFLERALEDLTKFLARDASLCRYSKEQLNFVEELAFQIAACYQSEDDSQEVASDMRRVVKKPNKYSDEQGTGFERDWCDYLTNLSSLEILRVFATADLGETSRELAIRQLNHLLSNHTTKKVEIEITTMRQLQPLLISCLQEEGLSDSMFKVLGEVVFHVANEMLSYQEDKWFHLWEYIGSQCKTKFQRAVYVFQCLTMKLGDGDFFIPVIVEKLLPEIVTRLNPPGELLVDNSCWVMAFVGAFCVANHLVEVSSHADSVEEITLKMVDSVRELVERGMEVGIVMRAFRDVESIFKKQSKWYSTSNYKFVKALLLRLCEINDMKMESRMVLWRINSTVDMRISLPEA
ncbi:unnamed protein product [Thlaspi arvense]|uniref:DUF577 domain-containing protein n=1 Tax=Thlaspi arvense TaxID=13288 RepID=A0AAU9T5H7_THLAR|nr:unnamed protein product [Thlaspi arvense]